MTILTVYLFVGVLWLVMSALYALEARGLTGYYSGSYTPEKGAREKAESACMVLLSPVWPVAVLVFAVRVIWSLVKDIRAYYCNTNRKEVDR